MNERLTFKPATYEQIDEFIRLLHSEAAGYIDRVTELMQLTWEQFTQLVKTVGQVYAVYKDGGVVGYYWIEERDRVLHLHGLAIQRTHQGQGIGTEVLRMLAEEYTDRMYAIELGVHDSNSRALRLYKRLGFKITKRLDDLDFSVMQKSLP